MKKIFIALLTVSAAFYVTGCKKFLNVNTNPNDLSSASEDLLLSPVEEAVASYITAGINQYSDVPIYINYWMQNMTSNQPVPNNVTYVVYNSNFSDNTWYYAYVPVLNNLNILDSIAVQKGNSTYSGIAKTLKAYTLGYVTDWWGDVPYSEGLSGDKNFTPAYDSQESIYNTLQVILDSAIAQLGRAEGSQPSGDDFFYSGNTSKWIKLAYSLKARNYMHLTGAPGHDAVTQSNLALTALQNGMETYDDDCFFPYSGGQNSSAPLYWNFYNTTTNILASTYVESLKTRNDPRLSILVAPAANTGLYTGSVIGSGFGVLLNYSVAGSFYGSATSNGYIFNADEALFLKAEATFRVSGAAAAQPIYQQAILNNMAKLGLNASAANVTAYMAARGTLTSTNALQRIMEEKAVANYLSPENWTDWRRTSYPSLTVISTANGAPANISEIPRRMLYPQNEITSNPQSVQSATLTDRVWWDTE